MPGDVRQVRVNWTGTPGGPYLSLFHFEWVAGSANAARDGVTAFLTSLKVMYQVGLTAVCDAEQLRLAEGVDNKGNPAWVVIDSEASGAPVGVAGTEASEPVPPASQGLIRLKTAAFEHGRRIQGRLYIPGVTEGFSQSGNPNASYISATAAAANTLRTSSPTFGPWVVLSRKWVTHGEVTSCSTWSKFGVQRRRRD